MTAARDTHGPAGSADRYPQFTTGPWPTVYADPAMCRELPANLIDNAIKYASPDQPANGR